MHSRAFTLSQTSPFRLQQITVAQYSLMAAEFAKLTRIACDINPHMSPAAVMAASLLLDADDIIILAAKEETRGHELAGVWAFSRSRPAWALGLPVLTSPLLPVYDVLSLPVIAADKLEAVLGLMLAHIATDPILPKLLRCPSLATHTLTGQALTRILSRHRTKLTLYETWPRAILTAADKSDPDAYLQMSLGKLHKHYSSRRRSLDRTGKISFAMHRKDEAIAALPRFLALEASGWKGRAGTAMASNPAHAAYATALVAELAIHDDIAFAELARDGQPLSMGMLILAGGTASFIKAAYDEDHRKYSPGFLLQMEVTKALLTDPAFCLMDSGMDDSGDLGIMVWNERQEMAHGLIAMGTAPTAWLAAHGLSLRQKLRGLRRQMSA